MRPVRASRPGATVQTGPLTQGRRRPVIGRQLAHYEIIAPLGVGGMAEVYRARDLRLKREVALKILPASTDSDPEYRLRFQREAETVASLNHPNIVHLYSVGHAEGVQLAVQRGAPSNVMAWA